MSEREKRHVGDRLRKLGDRVEDALTGGGDDDDRDEVTPAPDPGYEPYDPHLGPLDDDDDARYLDPVDPRRLEVERRGGRRFDDEED
jgi:hypothetical protein